MRTVRLLLALGLALSLAGVAVAAPAEVVAKRPGSAKDYKFLFPGGTSWPSCGSLTYRVNPDKAPEGWKQLVKKAVKKAHQASRLKFEYLGKTKDKPQYGSDNPADTDIVFAFLTTSQTDMMSGQGVAGEGGASSNGEFLLNGKVVLNGAVFKRMASGFGQGPRYGIQGTTGQVVMHELGHALGLGHAKQRTQVMYFAATRKPAEWGAGDWAGLKKLGKGGCDQRVPAVQAPVFRSLS